MNENEEQLLNEGIFDDKNILHEIDVNMTFQQNWNAIKLLTSDWKKWEVYDKGFIDENGKITKKGRGQLDRMTLFLRNIKYKLLDRGMYTHKGKRKDYQELFDANFIKRRDLLKEDNR